MCTSSGSPSTAPCSTSRAVDSLSITPPGGATDSIRSAIPTCSPIAVYPEWARTDFAGNHLARVQPDPQLQIDAVTAFDLDRQPLASAWMSSAARQARKA